MDNIKKLIRRMLHSIRHEYVNKNIWRLASDEQSICTIKLEGDVCEFCGKIRPSHEYQLLRLEDHYRSLRPQSYFSAADYFNRRMTGCQF